MSRNSSSARRTKQSRVKWAIGVAAAGLVIWAAVTLFPRQPHTVFVNDTPIATVGSQRAAHATLARARTQYAPGIPESAARFSGAIDIRSADADATVVSVREAVRALQSAAPVQAEVFAIVADGQPVVGVSSKKDAEKALKLVKRKYVPKGVKPECEPTFKEAVRIEKRYIDASLVQPSSAEAARTLTTAKGKRVVHTIQKGDRAAILATRHGTTLANLIQLNLDKDLDRLSEGDELLINRPSTPITVVHRVLETRVVAVKPPTGTRQSRRGLTGTREIRSLMTYENGEAVGEEVISQVTTWD